MVRIFHGEDIPQMDPSYFETVKKFLHIGAVQKELVDPYCVVSFAGHMESTQVVWNEQNPKWNKQINLGVRVSEGVSDFIIKVMVSSHVAVILVPKFPVPPGHST